jgi:hypothetical protein
MVVASLKLQVTSEKYVGGVSTPNECKDIVER